MAQRRLPASRRVLFGLPAALVIAAAGTTYGVQYTSDGTTNVHPIQLEGILGTYGHESGAPNGNANVVEATYGYHCGGASCHYSTQPLDWEDNFLGITCRWTPANSLVGGLAVNYAIEASVLVKNKTAIQVSADHTEVVCGPAPEFWATCMVSPSRPAEGSVGSDDWAPYPNTMTCVNTHQPGGTNQPRDKTNGGPGWADGSPYAMETALWDVNLDDPSTLTKRISTKVRTDFLGSASEVIVTTSKYNATVRLEVVAMAL